MGGVANNYMANVLPALALPIFSVGLGVEAWKVGLALALPRIWDALTDPIIGHLSDSCKSRWGRRRPFILAGALASLATYALLWVPTPEWSADVIFWWFMCTSFLYYMGETKMGAYTFSSWTLHMASIIIFSTIWGLFLHEWRGSSRRTMTLVFLGLLVLVASTVIVGYGNFLGEESAAH